MKPIFRMLALGWLATSMAWSQNGAAQSAAAPAPAKPEVVAPAAPAPAKPAVAAPAAPAPAKPEVAAPAAPAPAKPAVAAPAAPAPAKPEVVAPAAPAAPTPAKLVRDVSGLEVKGETLKIQELLSPEIVELFEALPVQDGGRVKPLDTIARFRLLRFHGKQSMRVDAERFGKKKISAVEWVILTWFKPEVSRDLPVFVVDNSEAVVAIQVKAKGPRDRYSYNEIEKGRNLLIQKMQEIRAIEPNDRSPMQRTLGKLALDFLDYEMMMNHFNFVRSPFGANLATVPDELVTPLDGKPVDLVALLPRLQQYVTNHPEAAAPVNNPWMMDLYNTLLGAMMNGNPEQALRIFPPDVNQQEVWQGPGDLLQKSIQGGDINPYQIEEFRKWGEVYKASFDQAKFKQAVEDFVLATKGVSTSRGEYRFVPLEVNYHKSDYFYVALLWFFASALALGLSWTSPNGKFGKVARGITWATVFAGTYYSVAGIVVRCIIMQRPPITTLYETILFITASGVLLALIAEWFTKKGTALTSAVLSGVIGMYLSIRYMNMEGTDTMQQLQAVLITNFWLATHVPIINLGYSAGMISAILGMFYFVRRLLNLTKPGDAYSKDLIRLSYGFIMVGLFLSLVGTILGGIWANDSWGRFWGWDPKENGALMIVLMNLIILHARMGGYIREVGFHAFAIILGIIVIFSWFGTNQLGVGLHAYGFTDGVWGWLTLIWSFLSLFLVYAAYLFFKDRKSKASK